MSLMRYLLMLHGSPWSHQSVKSASDFAKAAIAQGHSIDAIFLYQDGVTNALPNIDISSDEFNGQSALLDLHNHHGVPLWLCVTAGVKRGVNEEHVHKGFKIAGLAEFAEASTVADKVIQFK